VQKTSMKSCRDKLSLASEAELAMKARISELEDNLKAKSMTLVASHKDVDALKSRLADSEAAHKAMSDQFYNAALSLRDRKQPRAPVTNGFPVHRLIWSLLVLR